MLRAVLGVIVVSSALALAAAANPAGTPRHGPAGPGPSPSFTILNRPRNGDEVRLKQVIQGYAQTRSDALFQQLAAILGGNAPRLNFVPTGSPLTPGNSSTNLTDKNPYAPKGTINMDPLAVEALTNDRSDYHNSGVNGLPHEMAHTRQLPDVLGSTPLAEGGAQGFADIVTAAAAQRAKIPYLTGNYDGDYADYVTQANATKGRDWLLGGQFGRPPVSWP